MTCDCEFELCEECNRRIDEEIDNEELLEIAEETDSGHMRIESNPALGKFGKFINQIHDDQIELGLEYQGDPRFQALLDDMRKMHIAKSAGYAGVDNPDVFANFRQCEEIGIPAFLGAFIRKMDKDSRLRSLIVNPHNDMIGEGLEDTLFDSSSYDLIVKLLFEEDKQRNIRFLELLYELNKQLDREFLKMVSE